MGAPGLAIDHKGFADRLCDLLDRVDYRVAVTDAERDEIFRLRYEAYLRDGGIATRFDERLSDRYDDLDNTIIVGMTIDGELATTMRVSVASAEFRDCPAAEVFGDVLEPYFAAGRILLDPTRFVHSEKHLRLYPGYLPYLTTRIPWMMAEYYQVDVILSGCRLEHRAFYRRTFGFTQIAEARRYPTLLRPHFLMACDYPAMRRWVEQRYPSFRSSAFERRMLVEGRSPPAVTVREAPATAAEYSGVATA